MINVSEETWEWLAARAAIIDKLESAKQRGVDPWNDHRNMLGQIGEWFYSKLCGLPMKEPAIKDGGTDFPGLDVKAVPYYDNPILMRHAEKHMLARLYYLVAVDLKGRRVRGCGYATREMLVNAPVRDFGVGPTHCLSESALITRQQAIEILQAEAV